MTEPKYAVLKYRQWQILVEQLGALERERTSEGEDPDYAYLLITDAEVLRHKDLTVAPLLHSYASNILGFMEVLNSTGALSETQRRNLQDIADHFHEAAVTAEQLPGRKLPD